MIEEKPAGACSTDALLADVSITQSVEELT